MQEKSLKNATFLKRFDFLKNSLRLSDEKASAQLGITRQTIFKIRKGLQNATSKIQARLEIAEAAAGIGGRPQTSNMQTAYPDALPVRRVKVYGYAQALGARMHKGDLVPENEHELETVLMVDDGRRYAGFKVEGDSMAPKIPDGVTAMADPDAEVTNGCVVVCKWDDTVTIKRYRRSGNIIYLRSDNPAAGQDYEVHAKKMEWIMRVVELNVKV